MTDTRRLHVVLPDRLLAEIDRASREDGFENRSQWIRFQLARLIESRLGLGRGEMTQRGG